MISQDPRPWRSEWNPQRKIPAQTHQHTQQDTREDTVSESLAVVQQDFMQGRIMIPGIWLHWTTTAMSTMVTMSPWVNVGHGR